MYTKPTKKTYLTKSGNIEHSKPNPDDYIEYDGSSINVQYAIEILDEFSDIVALETGFDSYPSNLQVQWALIKHKDKNKHYARVLRLFDLED